MTEHIASFIYDPTVPYGTYNVYACYDSMEDYDNRKAAFYDLYDNSGLCVNEGDPLCVLRGRMFMIGIGFLLPQRRIRIMLEILKYLENK